MSYLEKQTEDMLIKYEGPQSQENCNFYHEIQRNLVRFEMGSEKKNAIFLVQVITYRQE